MTRKKRNCQKDQRALDMIKRNRGMPCLNEMASMLKTSTGDRVAIANKLSSEDRYNIDRISHGIVDKFKERRQKQIDDKTDDMLVSAKVQFGQGQALELLAALGVYFIEQGIYDLEE
jgi:hypothetical protein